MKKLFRHIILHYTRKQVNKSTFYDRMRKIQLYSLYFFIFFLLVLGLDWTLTLLKSNISLSAKLNSVIFWSLIVIFNSLNFTFMYFFKFYSNFRNQYKDNLMKEDYVMVGFKDNTLELNKVYIVLDYNNYKFNLTGNNYFLGNMLIDGDISLTKIIEDDKIFKFISAKQNRKLKLLKLNKI